MAQAPGLPCGAPRSSLLQHQHLSPSHWTLRSHPGAGHCTCSSGRCVSRRELLQRRQMPSYPGVRHLTRHSQNAHVPTGPAFPPPCLFDVDSQSFITLGWALFLPPSVRCPLSLGISPPLRIVSPNSLGVGHLKDFFHLCLLCGGSGRQDISIC